MCVPRFRLKLLVCNSFKTGCERCNKRFLGHEFTVRRLSIADRSRDVAPAPRTVPLVAKMLSRYVAPRGNDSLWLPRSWSGFDSDPCIVIQECNRKLSPEIPLESVL